MWKNRSSAVPESVSYSSKQPLFKRLSTILEGLQYVQQEFPTIVNKDAVMNALTDIRQQTAIESGIAVV